jgi:alkylhydroperoxidase family enzyme
VIDASIAIEESSSPACRFDYKIATWPRDAAQPEEEEMAMLEEKTRIAPVDIATLPDDLRATLGEQRRLWGAPLYPYLFYARNPAFFRAAQEMWTALQRETKRVPVTLRALLNRRVAWWNGCEY